MLIIKLSALLRRLLRSHEHFVTLREELESVDEYLDIEVVRFGPALRVRKDIDPATLDLIVPSMILQPLVENSIKHGFARKVGTGSITIRSQREHGRAIIEIEDDGLGFLPDRLDQPMSSGIGLANVRERLRVIYGAAYQLKIASEPGKGTRARIEVPELAAAEQITA
jgi:two-component system LytT family sensor kinase